ncbi:MAG: hypothetical protein ABJA34_12780 [Pseudonocardiales bacterium]
MTQPVGALGSWRFAAVFLGVGRLLAGQSHSPLDDPGPCSPPCPARARRRSPRVAALLRDQAHLSARSAGRGAVVHGHESGGYPGRHALVGTAG